MKKLIYICIITVGMLVLNTDHPLLAQWYQQYSPTRENLYGVHFADSSNGWAVGSKGTIIHTTNGGATWNQQISGQPLLRLWDVFPVDKNTCWTIGDDTLVLKTIDGGETWTKLHLNISLSYYWNAQSLYFADSLTGWIGGEYGTTTSDSNFVLHTTDGGLTWNKQYTHTYRGCYRLSGVSKEGVWAICYSQMSRTTDGMNWKVVYDNLGYNLFDMVFVDSTKGWVTSTAIIGGTLVLMSTNGGISWNLQKRFECSSQRIYVSFPDERHGWVVQSSCVVDGLEIWNTQDGGTIWNRQLFIPFGMAHTQGEMYFIDTLSGWMVGDSGMIWHASNGGITGINDGTDDLPTTFSLEQNFPNPFNPTTTIVFTVTEPGYTSLDIYDILGRKIETLVNEKKLSGKYRVEWHVESYAGGVYLYKLKTAKGTLLKKMVLVK